jgi:hypothetical protein
LTLRDGFPVSLAITRSTLKLLSVISAITASAGQAAAFEIFGSILVQHPNEIATSLDGGCATSAALLAEVLLRDDNPYRNGEGQSFLRREFQNIPMCFELHAHERSGSDYSSGLVPTAFLLR